MYKCYLLPSVGEPLDFEIRFGFGFRIKLFSPAALPSVGGSPDFEIRSGFGIEIMLFSQMIGQSWTDPDVVEFQG